VLRIRLTRTGRTKQESFRIVVAEHARPVKGKFIEVIGHYMPAKPLKPLEIQKDRVEYWMGKGAQPSGSVAALLKKNGMQNMEKYLEKRMKDIKKKSEMEKDAAAAKAAPTPVAAAKGASQ